MNCFFKLSGKKLVIDAGIHKGEYESLASDQFTADSINKRYVFFNVSPVIIIDVINDKIFFEELIFSGVNGTELVSAITDFFNQSDTSGNQDLQSVITNGNTTDKDIELTNYTKGIILKTVDGARARVTLTKDDQNNLQLTITAL